MIVSLFSTSSLLLESAVCTACLFSTNSTLRYNEWHDSVKRYSEIISMLHNHSFSCARGHIFKTDWAHWQNRFTCCLLVFLVSSKKGSVICTLWISNSYVDLDALFRYTSDIEAVKMRRLFRSKLKLQILNKG